MIVVLLCTSSLAVVVYGMYLYVSSLRPEDNEIRNLDQDRLQLGHVLKLLEAPDVQFLMEDDSTRKDIFVDFSEDLRQDVAELLERGRIPLTSLPTLAAFLLVYHSLRLKARLFCGREDLRFLANLELILWRAYR